jgi:aminoglycoside phosphotransferase (APT) family kinase protein
MKRRPGGVALVPMAHDVERELRVLHALNKLDRKEQPPIPKAFALCKDRSVNGETFYVMEFCRGRIFQDDPFLLTLKDEAKLAAHSLIEPW